MAKPLRFHAPDRFTPRRPGSTWSAALRESPKAKTAFARLPPSHQRQWQHDILDAKQAETRQRRAARAIA